jgi:hypothetical protein
VPPFDALAALQDKLAARATLAELGLPQPDAVIAATASQLAGYERLPAFVKTPIGTATTGVRYVTTSNELISLASAWEVAGVFDDCAVLALSPVAGPRVMIQSVFEAGELVASHSDLRVREGANGGASHKRSVDLPAVRDHLGVLGRRLGWHGALSADAILTCKGPVYIDINPRLVEPGNARRAGVDLVGALLSVGSGETAPVQEPGRAGVATHQLPACRTGCRQT